MLLAIKAPSKFFVMFRSRDSTQIDVRASERTHNDKQLEASNDWSSRHTFQHVASVHREEEEGGGGVTEKIPRRPQE